MARTIKVIGPPGMPSPSLRLVDSGDTIAETIPLTERTNAFGIYDGTISLAGAGSYSAHFLSGANEIGSFEAADLSGNDPESVTVRDTVNSTGGGGGTIGPGSIEYSDTVESPPGTPLAGADVWVTTDAAGTNVVAGTVVTDAFGAFAFMLDAGSYYLWVQKSGHNFSNPTSITVS